MNHIDAGHHLEQLASHVARSPVAGRCHVGFARVGLGVSNELGNGLGRNRWIEHHDQWHTDDARDWGDVADEIEIEFVIQRRVNCGRWCDQEERITVWCRSYDSL